MQTDKSTEYPPLEFHENDTCRGYNIAENPNKEILKNLHYLFLSAFEISSQNKWKKTAVGWIVPTKAI